MPPVEVRHPLAKLSGQGEGQRILQAGLAEAAVLQRKVDSYGDPRLYSLSQLAGHLAKSTQPLGPEQGFIGGGGGRPGDATASTNIFQLSVNKQGIIRGNYYDAVTDTTAPVTGSVDKQTQRAAWTVGDRPTPIYDAGIANLTKDETTMLVHYGGNRSQQFSLIRVEDSEKKEP